MIKKFGLIVMLLMAINFLAVVGGVGYLFGTGKVDADKLKQIGKILHPDPPPPTSQPATRQPTTQPLLQLDELLARTTGKTAAEQVAFLREMVDSMSASLERQRNEIVSLKSQVDLAQQQLSRDRAALDAREQRIAARETRQRTVETDVGFQQTLEIYNAMETKQIKDLFMKLDDATVVRYLQAMEPRRVSRIVKEFTAPAELSKAQFLLEAMRKNDVSPEANNASSPSAAASNDSSSVR